MKATLEVVTAARHRRETGVGTCCDAASLPQDRTDQCCQRLTSIVVRDKHTKRELAAWCPEHADMAAPMIEAVKGGGR